VGTIVIVGTNFLFHPMAERMARAALSRASRKKTEVRTTTFTMDIACSAAASDRVRTVVVDAVDRSTLSLRSLQSTMPSDGIVNIKLNLVQPGSDRKAIEQLTSEIASIDGVKSAMWDALEKPA
jgi:uncharacterized membrane protein YhiD involved in acid resistance